LKDTEQKKDTPLLVTRKKMRFDTYLTILNAIRNDLTTKRTIHDTTRISWASCSDIINDLSRFGIIMEDNDPDRQLYRPGPKTTIYKFTDTDHLILGLEITPTSINSTIIDLGKRILFKKAYILQEELTNINLYRLVRNIFYQVLEDADKSEESITTLVFALTGALDRDNLIWITSPKVHSVRSVDFHFFQQSLPFIKQVFIEHDITARANSIIRTDNSHPKNFAFLHISDGVGMAVMNNGVYIKGERGLAGEIGHIPILGYTKISGLPCYCGKQQCLESFLSSKAILHHISTTYDIDLDDLGEMHKRLSEEQSEEVRQLVFELLMNTTITIENIFDLRTLYIGGWVVEQWHAQLQQTFKHNVQEGSWLGGPKDIVFYDEETTNPSYGAAISVIHTVMHRILMEVLT